MNLLLDTNALIWWHLHKNRVGRQTTLAIKNAKDVYVSVISGWEIMIKSGLRRLHIDDGFADIVGAHGFRELPLTYDHIKDYGALPDVHKDPFDRILVAQAISEDLIFVSSDKIFEKYPVSLIRAEK
jgi:PIN domain nuclease of toxin-antitoxin system